MVITNQGVDIQPGFSSKTTFSFENRPIGCVYKKLGQNMHQMMRLNLPFSKPSGKS